MLFPNSDAKVGLFSELSKSMDRFLMFYNIVLYLEVSPLHL